MHSPRRIAVAGASGRVGSHVVDVLEKRGHEVVPISRAHGVDVITAENLEQAIAGADCVIDAATGPSPEQDAATEFFVTAARNLQKIGSSTGVRRIVTVSIIGADRFDSGYGAAKIVHESAALAGPIPTIVVRAAQFHEFVEQLLQWGTQGEIAYVPEMRTQLVAARSVAEVLADVATQDAVTSGGGPVLEVAGPREESLVDAATLLAGRRGSVLKVEGVSDPTDSNCAVYENGGLLPGPDAILTGPTFEEWLDATT